ncbi:MAG: hypothetical protein HZA50_12935 [Planctomycetes bacterium]|nr:hypothetical protein [Planctomycetota bacterium]
MTEQEPQSGQGQKYAGEVAYIYAYDAAYEMARRPIPQLLGQQVTTFAFDSDKRIPRDLFFYRPQMIRLPAVRCKGPHGPVEVRRTVKLYSVGAVSITVHVPFGIDSFDELVAYHDLELDGESLHKQTLELARQVCRELGGLLIRPVRNIREDEPYTVFCIHPSLLAGQDGRRAETWLAENGRKVASLLTQEPNVDLLSEQEVKATINNFLSYYDYDLVVMDWDAALLIDEPQNFPETLHVIEMATVQLAEIEAYDRQLDEVLQRSYADLSAKATKNSGKVLAELREIRLDFARVGDELSNITKFFGYWHLARIYGHLCELFGLPHWQKVLDEKLKTLDELYQLFTHNRYNRIMAILEVAIVVCFIIDLVILFLELMK